MSGAILDTMAVGATAEIDLVDPEFAATVTVDNDVASGPTGGGEEKILDAAVALVARWGVTKTALADVAKEAGCSRATVYRAFPGGKQHLFAELGRREVATYIEAIVEAIDTADDLADAVTRGLVVATRLLRDHDAAQFLLEHEPGILLPFLGFHEVDRVYRHTAKVVGPHLERFVPAERAAWLAEWAARTFLTYLFKPDAEVDLASIEATRRLVDTFILPAFAPTTNHSTSTATPLPVQQA